MLDLSPSSIMNQNFGLAKGFFAEVYVAQSILAMVSPDMDQPLYSWQEGESEIEFILSGDLSPIPIEVKSGHRTKARSLGQYISKYNPKLAIRLSSKPLSWDPARNLLNLPLSLAHWIEPLRNLG